MGLGGCTGKVAPHNGVPQTSAACLGVDLIQRRSRAFLAACGSCTATNWSAG